MKQVQIPRYIQERRNFGKVVLTFESCSGAR